MTGHHHDGAPAVEALAVPAGPASLDLLPLLAEALAGDRPVMPHAASGPVPPVPDHDPASLPEALAVVVGTSGSTGSPKRAMLTAPALRASARATHATLGGPGQWLLAIPAHHIAGLQVLVRSLDAGTSPLAMDLTDGFRPAAFVAATADFTPGARRYTSLVPTQVIRILDHPGGADALRTFDAVLVGGAAMPPRLRARAERARVHLVATYGMSETAGGCVYDGRPLPRTEVEIDEEGRILLGGPTIAHGYLGLPDLTAASFWNRRRRHPVVPHRRRRPRRRPRRAARRRPRRRPHHHRWPQGGPAAGGGGDPRARPRHP
jgi:O-succinylbenzoic acid--CoA ligase